MLTPKHLILAEKGHHQPRELGVNTMNRDHDDEVWVGSGWKAWTHDGAIYYEAEERRQVEEWLAANGYIDMGDHEHYQRPSEHLILYFPVPPVVPDARLAEAYARSKVGQLMDEWLILSTRVVVDKQEPLSGRVLGMCVQVDRKPTKAECQELMRQV